MLYLYGTRNCGVFEIDHLSSVDTPKEAFIQAMFQINRFPIDFPFVTFTGVSKFAGTKESYLHVNALGKKEGYGEEFAAYLEENKLGRIVRSGAERNWSNNDIQLWIWVIDRKASNKLFKELLAIERGD